MSKMLEVIIDAGPRLITAGVTELSLGGVTLRLAGAVPVPSSKPVPTPDPAHRTHVDPMRDPSTYPGGHVPRYLDRLTTEGAEYPFPAQERRR